MTARAAMALTIAAAACATALTVGCGSPSHSAAPTATPGDASANTETIRDVPLRIDDQAADRPVPAQPARDGRLAGRAALSGQARPFSTLRLTGPCRAKGCTISASADADGRWRTRLTVTAPASRPFARVTASIADETAVALVRLRGPDSARRATRRHRDDRPRERGGSAPPRDASRSQDAVLDAAQPETEGDLASPPRAAPAAPPADGQVRVFQTADGRPAVDQTVGPAGGPEVLVVGDSLQVQTAAYLQRYLPTVRWTVNAVGGYSSLQIYELFTESFRPQHQVVVFDAGTNDNPNYPQILAGRLDLVAARAGERCMVVPTIHGLPVEGTGDRGKNRAVRAFALGRPGTQVPDWQGAVAAHPEMMQPDDLHPVAAGADLRAQIIAAGVADCLAYMADRRGR